MDPKENGGYLNPPLEYLSDSLSRRSCKCTVLNLRLHLPKPASGKRELSALYPFQHLLPPLFHPKDPLFSEGRLMPNIGDTTTTAISVTSPTRQETFSIPKNNIPYTLSQFFPVCFFKTWDDPFLLLASLVLLESPRFRNNGPHFWDPFENPAHNPPPPEQVPLINPFFRKVFLPSGKLPHGFTPTFTLRSSAMLCCFLWLLPLAPSLLSRRLVNFSAPSVPTSLVKGAFGRMQETFVPA